MGKESLNRILDTLEVTHLLSSRRKVLTSTELLNTIEQKDILIRVEQGVFSADQNHEIIPNGSYYLIPRGI
ncbi:MAG: hypothetical protein IPP71_13705 [Bacteroidetes bacterium]|nr:hypothetical protein [Bacteroidota bacterium]